MHCADNHPPIDHEEFHCPLCAAIADLLVLHDLVSDLQLQLADGKAIRPSTKLDRTIVLALTTEFA